MNFSPPFSMDKWKRIKPTFETFPSHGEFLSPDNMCGAALLRLTSRGSALITELMELAELIPPIFHVAAKEAMVEDFKLKKTNALSNSLFGWLGNKNDIEDSVEALYPFPSPNISIELAKESNNGFLTNDKKYCALLFDFSYLNDPEEYERRINNLPDNVEIEAAFAATHRDILVRFYYLFESFYQYQSDLNKFSIDLNQGYYIQYTMDSVLLDEHGRQLLCEAVSFYGLILLLMDRFIPGPVRERIIIAFFRYCGQDGTLTNIDEVCKLCRSTGWIFAPTRKQRKPPKYEEKLFARFPLPKDLIRNVIGRILSDDIYMQSLAFPNFIHRSSRLAKQASLLYIILFFEPQILHEEMGTMREIVDKFFCNNWVIPIYMGITIDLSEEWRDFEAATTALNNVLVVANVKRFHECNAKEMFECLEKLDHYLTKQILTDQYVLDHANELLNFMRQCNVAIRWRMLHRLVAKKQFAYIIDPVPPSSQSSGTSSDITLQDSDIVCLLLQSSQFDMKLKESFTRLLETKATKWNDLRQKATQRMIELSEYFTGELALTRVSRDDNMTQWFAGMAEEIKCLNYGEEYSTVTGQKIQQYIQTLDDVEQYDIIDRNIQVKAFLNDTKNLLLQMVRAVSIKVDIIKVVDSVSNMSCIWEVVHDYIDSIHEHIRSDPYKAISLRALFLKLSDVVEVPIFRMKQSNATTITKTTNFYTDRLTSFIKEVLEVIPKSLFSIILEIIKLKEQTLRRLPVKIQVDSLNDYSQIDERYNLAKLTYTASFFTDGISIMNSTHLNIDHQQLLDECIRKELVRQVSIIMHVGLSFDVPKDSEASTLVAYRISNLKSFRNVANRIDGIRRAIESIQDYIGIGGLKIWNEEYARIMRFNTELESRKYTGDKKSNKFQSKSVPIPRFVPNKTDPHCSSFMGRTLTALLRMSDSQITIYSQVCNGWFLADGTEMCGPSTFSLLRRAIGVSGLSGLDQLLCFRIKFELERFLKYFGTSVKESAVLIEQVREVLFPEWKTPKDTRLYSAAIKKMEKFLTPAGILLRRIGQAQLLRKMVRTELQQISRINVNALHQSISSLNGSLLSDIISSYNDSEALDIPESLKQTSFDLAALLDSCGEGNPTQKIFVKADPLEGLPVFLLLFVISTISKFDYDTDFRALVRSSEEIILDGWPVIVGLSTLLKQFHQSYAKSLLGYIAQFVRTTIEQSSASRDSAGNEAVSPFPSLVKNTLIFTTQLCSISKVPDSVLHSHIPQYLLELCCGT